MSPTGLTAVPEKRAFAQDAIAEICASDDPWWDGMLIGAGIGMSPLLFGAGVDSSEQATLGSITTLSVGVGATIGALLDASRGRKLLYYAPQQTRGVTFSPILAKDRQGVLVAIGF